MQSHVGSTGAASHLCIPTQSVVSSGNAKGKLIVRKSSVASFLPWNTSRFHASMLRTRSIFGAGLTCRAENCDWLIDAVPSMMKREYRKAVKLSSILGICLKMPHAIKKAESTNGNSQVIQKMQLHPRPTFSASKIIKKKCGIAQCITLSKLASVRNNEISLPSQLTIKTPCTG